MKIFDFSNPTSPVLVGRYRVREWAHGVKVSGQHAYVITSEGFEVIDVSRPEQPVRVGIYDALIGHAWDVHVQGDHAYLADGVGLRDFFAPTTDFRITAERCILCGACAANCPTASRADNNTTGTCTANRSNSAAYLSSRTSATTGRSSR